MVPRIRTHVRRTPRRRLAIAFSLAATLAGGLFAALPASAVSQTYYVNDGTLDGASGPCSTTPDVTSVEDGYDAAVDGDIIHICPGSYTVSGAGSDGLVVEKDLTIEGEGAATVTLAPSDPTHAVFTVYPYYEVTFSDLSITGACHAVVASIDAIIHLDSVVLHDNSCSGPPGGAALLADNGATIDIVDSVFEDNAVQDAMGGAIYLAAESTVTIDGTRFEGNSAQVYEEPETLVVGGGAIGMYTEGDAIALDITDSEFVDNSSDNADPTALGGSGGAIYAYTYSDPYDVPLSVSVSGSLFDGNTASDVGGAIALRMNPELSASVSFSQSLDIEDSRFTDNGALGIVVVDPDSGDITEVQGGLGGAIFTERTDGAIKGDFISVPDDPSTPGLDEEVRIPAFELNMARAQGGGVWIDADGSLVVGGSATALCPSFESNYAEVANYDPNRGGAIYTEGPLTVSCATFYANGQLDDTFTKTKTRQGGAIYATADVTISTGETDDTVVFEKNFARKEGGGLYAQVNDPDGLEITGTSDDLSAVRFVGNEVADRQGPALWVEGSGDASITYATFSDNVGANSGAIASDQVDMTIDTAVFDGNLSLSSSFGGGAITVQNPLTVRNSSFTDNVTGGQGGAIWSYNGSVPVISGSLFDSNSSGQHGGAIWTLWGAVVRNSTFTNNGVAVSNPSANYSGLAIYLGRSDGLISLTHTTVAAQNYTGGNDGSVIKSSSYGELVLRNSIVDETTVMGDPRCVIGTKTDSGGNIVTSSCAGFATATDSADIDLQPLADNGGPTETMALTSTSAAVDASACITTPTPIAVDQRGSVRPYSETAVVSNRCDAGAYEATYTVTKSGVSDAVVDVGETVDDDVTVEGYLDDGSGGVLDPQGSVEFSYCFDASATPDWSTCSTSASIIGTAELTGSGGGAATVSLSDITGFSGGWDPASTEDGDGAGYYLFHAEYLPHEAGDSAEPEPNGYLGSEDDGTNEAFTYGLVTDVTTTTTTRVSRSEITFGQSVRDVATVTADEGTADPTGDVEFSYCFDASSWPTWGSCTPVSAGTVTLAGGTDAADATSTAQSGLVTPSAVGYYLFHAEYLGDEGFEGSEDDGTNERVRVLPAPTFVDLTSGTYFTTGTTSVGLTATVFAPAGCLEGRSVTVWRDVDGDGAYELQIGDPVSTNASGVTTPAVSLTVSGGIYEIEERVTATPDGNCLETTNTATIVVASSADSANGGGHYVNSGRINFGFTVQIKTNPKTATSVVSGQMTWHKQGGYRLKGSVTSSIKVACSDMNATRTWSAPTGAVCSQISGTASYSRWDGSARRWILVSTGVGYRMFVVDGGTATVCVRKTCSTTTRPDWFRMDVPSLVIAGEYPDPIQLKGGGIYLK